jgi:hypothetical protein
MKVDFPDKMDENNILYNIFTLYRKIFLRSIWNNKNYNVEY